MSKIFSKCADLYKIFHVILFLATSDVCKTYYLGNYNIRIET